MHGFTAVFYTNYLSFLLSGWDTDFATEAYRQQVEALAQHQVSKNKLKCLNVVEFSWLKLCFMFAVDGRIGI